MGKVRKTLSRRRKEEGGEKKRAQRARRARGSNPGPAACQARVPSCTPWGLFRQASLSVPIDRVGRLRNTRCCAFWRSSLGLIMSEQFWEFTWGPGTPFHLSTSDIIRHAYWFCILYNENNYWEQLHVALHVTKMKQLKWRRQGGQC